MNIFRFAAEDGPHIAIAPEYLFSIGGVDITNSILYGWISAVLLLGLFFYLRKSITIQGSKGVARVFDALSEFIIGLMASSLGSREKALRYAPLFVTTFFFIVFNNWMGLLPGVGPALEYNGTPLLRPYTADLNATLAMAFVMIIIVQTLAIRESGIAKHIGHYFQGSMKNPMTYAIGGLEMFGELTRIASLALRLFLNIVIGKILISIFSYLGSSAAPLTALPFTLMELFIGLLQAYIFVVLCISYLAVATSHNHNHEEHA